MKKIIRTIQGVLIATTVSLLVTACNDQWDDHVAINGKTMQGTVLEAIKGNEDFSSFYAILQETGYDTVLNGDYEFTVFVPSNAAMAAYSTVDKEQKLAIVRNHIAYSACNTQELASKDKVRMVNGKNLFLSSFTIDSQESNIVCNNGIMHMVDKVIAPAMNINEYLESLPKNTYMQIDTLYLKTRRIMDEEKSIQIGVNQDGLAVYDTVWTTQNLFLDAIPISNEDSICTFVLLENENFETLKAKYAKYMKQRTEQKTDSIVTDELIRDLVFEYGKTTALSGVAVDFSKATTVSEYQASNGLVRIMKGVDIKIKENKVKTIWVEAEDYQSVLTEGIVYTRMRPWARGGKDVMVSSTTIQSRDSISTDDGVTVVPIEYTFTYNTNNQSKSIHFYLKYSVPMNSVDYDIYWLSYDDIESHVGTDGYEASTLKVRQKLFASMPGETPLNRNSEGAIENNYLGTEVAFGAYSTAGIMKEEHLRKYTLDIVPNMVLKDPVEEEPFTFSVSNMGNVTLMVCNTAAYSNPTAEKKSVTGGLMFLDYIKLVPRVDEGD